MVTVSSAKPKLPTTRASSSGPSDGRRSNQAPNTMLMAMAPAARTVRKMPTAIGSMWPRSTAKSVM